VGSLDITGQKGSFFENIKNFFNFEILGKDKKVPAPFSAICYFTKNSSHLSLLTKSKNDLG